MADEQEGSAAGESAAPEAEAEVVQEGWMLKLSRNRQWQERYFVFTSDQVLSYSHKKNTSQAKSYFHISREAGCEVSELYVEQRQKGYSKESLYCVSIEWSDDTRSSTSLSNSKNQESFRDDLSFLQQNQQALTSSPTESAPTTPKRSSRLGGLLGTPSFSRRISRQKSAPVRPRTSNERSRNRSASPVNGLRHNPSSVISDGDMEIEENSMDSLGTPAGERKRRTTWLGNRKDKGRNKNTSDQTPVALNFGDGKGRPPRARLGEPAVPTIVDMELESSVVQEYAKSQLAGFDSMPAKPPLPDSYVDYDVPVAEPNTQAGQVTFENKQSAEQEKLHAMYFDSQRKEQREYRKKVVESTKIAVAAGAVAGVGVLTAGVGLAAGLVFLGGAAAIGGTAGVAEAGIKRKLFKSGKLTFASTSYEQVKLWKSMLDSCLEMESLKRSTWGQMFAEDGRNTAKAFIPRELDMGASNGRDGGGSVPSDPKALRPLDLPKGQSMLFLKDRNFFGDAGARWRPLEGGWASFLGPGVQGLRIFREDKILMDQTSKKVAKLAVGGSTCTPLKTQLVLHAPPLDAFMCLMSFARKPRNQYEGDATPSGGQDWSFRVLEKIDDHVDVIHVVSRKLYLFPSWTEPRDFVLFRYWRYEDSSYIVCYESVEHPSCPPVPGFVRGEMHQVLTLAPPKNTQRRKKGACFWNASECLLTSVVQVDPKGWVPTKPIPFLSNQTYSDAFGVAALLPMLDIRDAIDNDRFLDVSSDMQQPLSTGKLRNGSSLGAPGGDSNDQMNYDLRYANRERCDSVSIDTLSGLESRPPPLDSERWAEPDANSFLVRGPNYKTDRVKINAGTSIGRLVAVDVVLVDKPIFSGMSTHPTERIQRALRREKKLQELGKESDMPPFVFVVNIVLPGPPFYHGVFYYAVDDMSTIDGSNGTGSSLLCQKFLFGDSDSFRDRTFKLIPQIVEGNFMVRKAVGSTPAIMGTKLQQTYVRHERYMEVVLNCGSSAVATGVIRLSLGYAKTLMIDMGFLLEADSEQVLPERIFGCVRMKYPEFGTQLRKVEDPSTVHVEK